MPFVKNGMLRALAVAQRTPLLPDVPAMDEALKGWGRTGSQALLAPRVTPLAVRQKISREVARIVTLTDIKERLDAVSFAIAPARLSSTSATCAPTCSLCQGA
jgi:tripartite-type tricarboxylate transporter receptor subunit TctC